MRSPIPCAVTADLNRYLAAMDEESFAGDMKENFCQSIMAEKLKLLDNFGDKSEEADELMSVILENMCWDDISHQIRLAFVARTQSSDLWRDFIMRPLEELVEHEAEVMYQNWLDIEKENRDLRGYY